MRQRVARRILSSAAHLILLSRQHEVGQQQQPQKSKLSLLLHHNWTTLQLHVRYQRGGWGRILILATISLEVVGTHMGDKHERGWWWWQAVRMMVVRPSADLSHAGPIVGQLLFYYHQQNSQIYYPYYSHSNIFV